MMVTLVCSRASLHIARESEKRGGFQPWAISESSALYPVYFLNETNGGHTPLRVRLPSLTAIGRLQKRAREIFRVRSQGSGCGFPRHLVP